MDFAFNTTPIALINISISEREYERIGIKIKKWLKEDDERFGDTLEYHDTLTSMTLFETYEICDVNTKLFSYMRTQVLVATDMDKLKPTETGFKPGETLVNQSGLSLRNMYVSKHTLHCIINDEEVSTNLTVKHIPTPPKQIQKYIDVIFFKQQIGLK